MSGAQENRLVASKRPASSEENSDHEDFTNTDTKRRVVLHTPLDFFWNSLNSGNRLVGCTAASKHRSANSVLYNIDRNLEDESLCHAYSKALHTRLRHLEKEKRPTYIMMRSLQGGATTNMRDQLVGWLIEVTEDMNMTVETLHLGVAYLDSFLCHTKIAPWALQLAGVSCMFIASKYNEMGSPDMVEYLDATDNTYSDNQLRKMERIVLEALNFELLMPTVKLFTKRYVRAAQASYNDKLNRKRLEHLTNYISELAISHAKLLRFLPSMVAAATVFLALLTIEPTSRPWTPTLEFYAGYRPSQLRKCAYKIYKIQSREPTFAPSMRYSKIKYKRVSSLPPPPFIDEEYFKDMEPVDRQKIFSKRR